MEKYLLTSDSLTGGFSDKGCNQIKTMTTQVFYSEISSTPKPETDYLMKLVSRDKQILLSKFKFDIDRKLSLYAELLVRYQIHKELSLKNEEIVFIKNEHGKPYLQDYLKFQFNISHTRNAIAVAFSSVEIGIDIEHIEPPDYRIAKRFFAPAEQEFIFSHENPEYAFYEIWTKKEAYIKFLGTGFSTPLKSFDVLNNKIKSMLHTFEASNYLVTTCYKEMGNIEPVIITITEVDLYTLLNEII